MCVKNITSVLELFEGGNNANLFPNYDFGRRFGFGRNRFQMLLRCLTLSNGEEDADDKWSPIRTYVEDFNNARREGFYPSWRLVVDEFF